MNNIFDKLEKLAQQRLMTRLKHLRGRHNQLDHAWNRGMGRGGGSLASNQIGPVPNEQMYRKQVAALEDQVRQGKITRAQSREQLAILRGNTSRNSALLNIPITLANRKKPKPNPDQITLDLFENSEPTPIPAPTLNPASTPKPKPASPALSVSEDTLPVRQRSIAEIIDSIRDKITPKITTAFKKFTVLDKKTAESNIEMKKYRSRYKVLMQDERKNKTELEQLTKEYDALIQESVDANNEHAKAVLELLEAGNEAIIDILESLSSSNPMVPTITFDAPFGSPYHFTPKQQEQITKIIKAVFALMPKSELPSTIRIQHDSSDEGIGGGKYIPSLDKQNGFIQINQTQPINNVVLAHEAMHALQQQQGFGVDEANDFGNIRTVGLIPKTMASIGFPSMLPIFTTYVTGIDDVRTFMQYPEDIRKAFGNLQYLEVMPMAISNLLGIHAITDQQHIETLLQAIKNTNPDDSESFVLGNQGTPKKSGKKRKPFDLAIKELSDDSTYPAESLQEIKRAEQMIADILRDQTNPKNYKFNDIVNILKIENLDVQTQATIIQGLFSIYGNITHVNYNHSRIVIYSENVGYGKFVRSSRMLSLESSGDFHIDNSTFKNGIHQQPDTKISGLGYAMLRRQALAAMLLHQTTGRKIDAETMAVNSLDQEYNGFSVWPKLGYIFPIRGQLLEICRANGFSQKDTASLMMATSSMGIPGYEAWDDIIFQFQNLTGHGGNQTGHMDYTDLKNKGLKVLIEYGRRKFNKTKDNDANNSDFDMDLINEIWRDIVNDESLLSRLKHLRGRHNQLDHAWNRGMGQGGSVALAPNQMGPVVSEDFYRKRARELENQVRTGQITRAQSRAELAQLRGNTDPIKNTMTLSNASIAETQRERIRQFQEERNRARLPQGVDLLSYLHTAQAAPTGVSTPLRIDINNQSFFWRRTPAHFDRRDNAITNLNPIHNPLIADSIASGLGLPIAPIAQVTSDNTVVTNAFDPFVSIYSAFMYEDLQREFQANPTPENAEKLRKMVEPLVMLHLIMSEGDGHRNNVNIVENPNQSLYGSRYLFASVDSDYSGLTDRFKSFAFRQLMSILASAHKNNINMTLLSPEMRTMLENFKNNVQWHPLISDLVKQQYLQRIDALLKIDDSFNSGNDFSDKSDAMEIENELQYQLRTRTDSNTTGLQLPQPAQDMYNNFVNTANSLLIPLRASSKIQNMQAYRVRQVLYKYPRLQGLIDNLFNTAEQERLKVIDEIISTLQKITNNSNPTPDEIANATNLINNVTFESGSKDIPVSEKEANDIINTVSAFTQHVYHTQSMSDVIDGVDNVVNMFNQYGSEISDIATMSLSDLRGMKNNPYSYRASTKRIQSAVKDLIGQAIDLAIDQDRLPQLLQFLKSFESGNAQITTIAEDIATNSILYSDYRVLSSEVENVPSEYFGVLLHASHSPEAFNQFVFELLKILE